MKTLRVIRARANVSENRIQHGRIFAMLASRFADCGDRPPIHSKRYAKSNGWSFRLCKSDVFVRSGHLDATARMR
jgi:hypothetical protein